MRDQNGIGAASHIQRMQKILVQMNLQLHNVISDSRSRAGQFAACGDPAKDEINRAKHGLSFEEASGLFRSGVDYLEIYDEEHSDEEDRFIAVGPIDRGVIVVSYTERDDDVLRILSARLATKNERKRFDAYRKGDL